MIEGLQRVKQIDLSIAWPFGDEREWIDAAQGNGDLLYARNTPQPIVHVFEAEMAKLEKTESAVSFSSGMAAIFASLFTLAKPGTRIVAFDAVYGGSYSLLKHVLPAWGVDVEIFDSRQPEEFYRAIARGCDLVYIETPSNPLLIETNIERVCLAAKSVGALVICDNTVATPYAQNPAIQGVDLVVHSATKFLSGHVDALAGVVCGESQLVKQLMSTRELMGSVLSPQAAHLVLRGMQTFELRMARATANARDLASWLEQHDRVKKVNYPGVGCERGAWLHNDVALLSFELDSRHEVSTFLAKLTMVAMASTLGSTQTIVGLPETTSHVECTAEERDALGVPEGLIRVSLGIESFKEVKRDFYQALLH